VRDGGAYGCAVPWTYANRNQGLDSIAIQLEIGKNAKLRIRVWFGFFWW